MMSDPFWTRVKACLLAFIFGTTTLFPGYAWAGWGGSPSFSVPLGLEVGKGTYRILYPKEGLSLSRSEVERLFETFLRIPPEILWVNLSPGYPPLPPELLHNPVGRLLLAMDYQFKEDLETILLRRLVAGDVEGLVDFPFFWVEPARGYLEGKEDRFFVSQVKLKVKFKGGSRECADLYSQVARDLEEKISSDPAYRRLREAFAVYLLANHLKRRLSRRGKKTLDSKRAPLRGVEVLGSWLYDDDPSDDPYEWKRAYLDRFFSPVSFSFRGKKLVRALGGIKMKSVFSWLRRKEVDDQGFLRLAPVPVGYQDIRFAKEEVSKEVLEALERELGMRYPEDVRLELVDVIGLGRGQWLAILYDYLADKTVIAYGSKGRVSSVEEKTGLPLPLFKGAIASEFDEKYRIGLCGQVGEIFTRAWIENGANLPVKAGCLPLSLIVVRKIDPTAPTAELEMVATPQVGDGLYLSEDQTVDLFVSTLRELRDLLGLEGGKHSYSVVNAFFEAWKQEPSLRPLLREVARRTGTIITWKTPLKAGPVTGKWSDRLRTVLLRAVRLLKDNRDGVVLFLVAVLGSALFPSLGFLPLLGLSVKKKKGKRPGSKGKTVELAAPKSAEELKELLADTPRWQKTIDRLSPEKLADWIDSAPISDCKDAELFYLWVTRVAQPFFPRGEVIWEPAYVPVYSALVRSFGRFNLEEMTSDDKKLEGIRFASAMMVLLGAQVEGETLDLLVSNLARFLVSYNATAKDLDKWKHRISAFSNAIDLLLDERIRYSNTYEGVFQEIAKAFFGMEKAVGVDDLLKSEVAGEILDRVKDFPGLLKEDLPTATEWLTMVFASRPETVRDEWVKAFAKKSASKQRLIRLSTGIVKFWMDLARERGGEASPSKIDEFSFELSRALISSNNPGVAQTFTVSLKEDSSAVARVFLGVAREGGIESLIQFLVYLVKSRAINEKVIAEALGSAGEDEIGALEGSKELIVRAWSATLLEIGRVDVLRSFSEPYWQTDPFVCALRFAGLLGEGRFAELNRDLSSLSPDQTNWLIGQIKRLLSHPDYRKYRMLFSCALVLLQGENWVSALKDRLESVDGIAPEEEVFLADLLEAVVYRLDRSGPSEPKGLSEIVDSLKRLSGGFSFTYPGVVEPLLILLWWLDRPEDVKAVIEKTLSSKSAQGIPRSARKSLEGIRSLLKGKMPAILDRKAFSGGVLPSLMLVVALERFDRWDKNEEVKSLGRYADYLLASDLRIFHLYGRAFKAFASAVLASRGLEETEDMEERLDSLAYDLSGPLDLPEEDLPWFVVKGELAPILKGIEDRSAWSRMMVLSYLSFVVGELAVNNKEEFWDGLRTVLSRSLGENLIPAIGLTAIDALEEPTDEVLSRGIIDSKEVKGWLVESLVRYAKTFSFTKPKQWKKRKGELKWLEDSLKRMVEFSRGKASLVSSLLEEVRSRLEAEKVDIAEVPLAGELKDLIASKEGEEEKAREAYGPLIEALNEIAERVAEYTGSMDPDLKIFQDFQQLYLAKAVKHLPSFKEDWLEAWRKTNPLGSSYIVVRFYSGKELIKELNIPNTFPLEVFRHYEVDWGRGNIVDRVELRYHQIKGLPLKASMDLRWLRDFLNNLDQYLSLWGPNLKSPPEVVLPPILAKYLGRPRQRAPDKRGGKHFELHFSKPVNRLPDNFKATRSLLTSLYLELHGDRSVVATDSLLKVADLLKGHEKVIWEGIEKRKPFLNKLKKLGLELGNETKIAVVGAQIGGRYVPVIVWLEPHPLGGQWVPRMVIYGARVEIFDEFGIAKQLLDKVLKVSLVAVPVSKALHVRKTVSWIGLKGGSGKPIVDSIDPIFKITRNWELDYMRKAMYCIAFPEDEKRDYRYYLVLAGLSKSFCLCKVPNGKEDMTFLDMLSYIEKSIPYDGSWWREIKKISFANAAGGKKMLLASSLVEKFFRDYPIDCEWVMLRMPKWTSLSGLWAQPKRVDINKYIVVSRVLELEKEKTIIIDFYEQITPVVGSMILKRGVDLLRDEQRLSYAFSLDFVFSENGMRARLYRKDKDGMSISSFLGWEEVNKFVFGQSGKRELVLSPAKLFPDYVKPVQSGKFVKTRHPVFVGHQSAFSLDFGGYKCGFAKSVYWEGSPLYELLKNGSYTMKGVLEENAGPDIKFTFYLKRENWINWEEVFVILVDKAKNRFRVLSKHPNLDIIYTPGQWRELGESTFMWFKGEDKDKVKIVEYDSWRKTHYQVSMARVEINVRRVLPWWIKKEAIFKVEKKSENKRVIKLIKRQGKLNLILGKVTVESFPDLGKRVVFDSEGNKICEFSMKRKQYHIRIEDLFPRVNDAFPVFVGLPSSREIIERANHIKPSNRLRGIGSLSIGSQSILHITVSSKSKESMGGELARVFDMGAFVFFYPNGGIITFAVPAIDLEMPVARIVKKWKHTSISFLWHLPPKNYNPLRKLSSYKVGPKHHGPPAIVISLYSLLPLAPRDPEKSQEWAQMYLERLRKARDFTKQELEGFYSGILKFFSIYYTGSGMVPVESWPILFRAKMIPGWKASYNFTLLPHYSGIAEFFEDEARVLAYRKFLRDVIVINPRVFSRMIRAGVQPDRFNNLAHYARWRTALCVLSMLTGDEKVNDVLIEYYLNHMQDFEHDARLLWEFEERFVGKGMRPDERELVKNAAEDLSKFYRTLDTRLIRMRLEEGAGTKLNSFALFLLPLTLNGIKYSLLQASLFSITPLFFPAVIGLTGWYIWKRLSRRPRRVLTSNGEGILFKIGSTVSKLYPKYRSQIYRILRSNDSLQRKAENLVLHIISHMGPYGECLRLEALSSLSSRLSPRFLYDLANTRIEDTYYDPFKVLDLLAREGVLGFVSAWSGVPLSYQLLSEKVSRAPGLGSKVLFNLLSFNPERWDRLGIGSRYPFVKEYLSQILKRKGRNLVRKVDYAVNFLWELRYLFTGEERSAMFSVVESWRTRFYPVNRLLQPGKRTRLPVKGGVVFYE